MYKPTVISVFVLLFAFAAFSQVAPDSTKTVSDSANIFTKVEFPASFHGGPNAWRTYLENNLNYPKKAQKKQIQGVVRVQFIVDQQGNISQVMALNDPGGGLAEEAVRIIQSSPRWKPAEQNRRKVIYRHIQSITFALQ